MLTDIEVRDLVYDHIRTTEIATVITGETYKGLRPRNRKGEDVVVTIIANQFGQIQSAILNVNVYVSDIQILGRYQEDTPRLRELSEVCMRCLPTHEGRFWLSFEEQRVYNNEETNEHVINNKMLFKSFNQY